MNNHSVVKCDNNLREVYVLLELYTGLNLVTKVMRNDRFILIKIKEFLYLNNLFDFITKTFGDLCCWIVITTETNNDRIHVWIFSNSISKSIEKRHGETKSNVELTGVKLRDVFAKLVADYTQISQLAISHFSSR